MDVKSVTEKYRDYIIEKRRYFHMNPEAGGQEVNTSKVIQGELEKLGIEYEVYAKTGVIGTIKGGKPGKTVLLRADMDALEVNEKNDVEYKSTKPGLMHACGHDGHTAMLLGAAHALNDIKDELEGNVKLFFQPSEENAWGAKTMMEESNVLDVVDGAFAIHLWQGVESGKVSVEAGPRMAAADFFEIKIKGKGGHGSMPQETIDACVVASAIVMNLQTLVSRNTDPVDSLVMTIGKMDVGTRFNVIASEGSLEGTSRSFSNEVWEKIPDQINRIINNTAATFGATAELNMNRATPPLINDEKISEILKGSMTKLYGEDSVALYTKTPGAEDFAYITQKVPGALAFVGIRNEEKGITAPHHDSYFNMDEDALQIGTNLYTQFAVDFLNENK